MILSLDDKPEIAVAVVSEGGTRLCTKTGYIQTLVKQMSMTKANRVG